MKFNVNHKVKIRLTRLGHDVLRANHMKLYEKYLPDSKPAYKPPEEDLEGWSTWQLWEVMREFGPHLHNGMSIPFETEIKLIGEGDDSTNSVG